MDPGDVAPAVAQASCGEGAQWDLFSGGPQIPGGAPVGMEPHYQYMQW